ncbi:PHD and RING finger domain-containing protein 1-like [Echeneis naucrates]|uniref:PHD and RING finger domain-containing protein 1-like n=1 Tax=Echeneis naucrates TaxID=173247 RepID=UPI00111391DE|nr:PHD and RING finger domain-containing protein 1-like [Echeneis naucrates]
MEKPCAERCLICLSLFEQQTVASPENCLHVFCLQCILLWSQTANTCPVDRISFTFIHQRRRPGGCIQKKIKVRTPKQDGDDEGEASNAVICEECGRSDRRHRLLVCIQCDSGCHMNCLTPPLKSLPEGDWICPECARIPHHTDESMVEEEISDGELTDLLAEIDDTPSTSSRLRPSTINQPRWSTERRRSVRVQSRTSSNPNPCPQTTLHVPKYLLRASRPPVITAEASAPHHADGSRTSAELNTQKRKRV